MLEPNLGVASSFLDALSDEGPGVAHTFQIYTEANRHGHARILTGPLPDVAEALVAANRDRLGVSVTVGASDGEGRTYANIVRPRAVFLDFDDGSPPTLAWDQADAVVRTARGWHLYYWLTHPDPSQPDWRMWELTQEAAADAFGAERIVDHTKALRLPGFYHHKGDPLLIELERSEPRRRLLPQVVQHLGLTLDFLRRPPPAPRRPRSPRYDPAKVSAPERLEQYRDWVAKQPSAVEGAGGHTALVRIIKMAWNFGVDWDAAWSVVEDFNARCDPPWRSRELRTQFESAGPIGESRGRFSHESWESAIWVPEPETVQREGARPDDVPFDPDAPTGRRRTVRRSAELPPPPPPAGAQAPADSPPEPPWPDDGGDGPPEAPPWPDDGDAPRGDRPPVLDPEEPLHGAQRFVELHQTDQGRRTLHRHHRLYWVWDGHYYREISDEAVEALLYPFLHRAKREVVTRNGNTVLKPYGTRRTRLTDVEKAMRSVCTLDERLGAPCWLDPQDGDHDPADLLVCRNGIVHLPTAAFVPPDPRLFVLNSLGVAYTPSTRRPEAWEAFLEQLWPEDRESVALLQEWFGYCLTPDVSHHKALILVGPPRAGKGTIAHILQALLSPASVTSMMMGDFVSEFGLWRLIGKTLAVIPDARVSGRYDSTAIVEKFLAITGGDVVSVNRKSLKPVDAQLKTRFMLLTNVVPQLADAAAAFPQRLLSLSLERSFMGAEDRELLPRLLRELPGILNWAIEGWHRLRANGRFTEAQTARHVADALEEASSPVRAFVRQCCTLEPGTFTATTELYEAWKRWCVLSGRQPGSISTFGRNLRAGVPEIAASRPRGAERARGFEGIEVDYTRLPQREDRGYKSPQTDLPYSPGEN